MTTPPARRPYYFDMADPDGPGIEPRRAATWLVDDFASVARHFPDWRHEESGTAVHLVVLAHQKETAVTLGWTAGFLSGTIEALPDPTGWLRIVGRVAGAEVFRGFLERPYEEYEIWPPGAGPARGEGPGRIGKRQAWVSFRVEPWPALRPLASVAGSINFSVDEDKLRGKG